METFSATKGVSPEYLKPTTSLLFTANSNCNPATTEMLPSEVFISPADVVVHIICLSAAL